MEISKQYILNKVMKVHQKWLDIDPASTLVQKIERKADLMGRIKMLDEIMEDISKSENLDTHAS